VATMNVSGPYTSASINGTQGMTLSESITGTKSYLGIVSSASGSSSCSVTATVSPPTVIAPTCTLSIDKSSLPAGGGQVVLNLTINGTADSSTIDGVAGTALTKNITTANNSPRQYQILAVSVLVQHLWTSRRPSIVPMAPRDA
jgi:hypothetical protein